MLINKSNFYITKTSFINKMKTSKNKNIKFILIAVFIVFLDQISKLLILITLGFGNSKNIIPHILSFNLVKNKGAAFSLFANSTDLLTITSILASFLIITIILKFPPRSNWNLIGLSYLLGGTVGNGMDRLLKGYVLDFFDLVPINFPIFNVADIAINIAVVCFLIDLVPENNQSRKQ